MRYPIILTLAAVAAFGACKNSTTGPGAPSTGTLTVVVTTAAGGAVTSASVRLEPGARSVQTNAQGVARFADLAAGNYTVTVQAAAGTVEQQVTFRPPTSELRLTISELGITGGGTTILWGSPDSLRAVGGRPGGVIVWTSNRDFYFGRPAELGRGTAVSLAPLRPGTTTVTASLVVGSQTVATASTQVTVLYRESWNVDLLGIVGLTANTVGDVWVQGRNAFVARRGFGGFSVVDVDALSEIGRFTEAGLFSQDIDVVGNIAYVTQESFGTTYPFVVTFVDVSDPRAPRRIGGVPIDQVTWAHTVLVNGTIMYIANSRNRLIHVWDVSDPAAPRELSTIASTNGIAHDMHVRDGIFYGAYMQLSPTTSPELVVANVVNPAAPAILSRVVYPDAALVHSAWTSRDGRYVFVADEVTNAPIRIFDVANPSAPVLVATYQPRFGTVPHHIQVRGDIAYLTMYKNGVEVLDVTDPVHPRLVGFYDTHPGQADDGSTAQPGNVDLYRGAWGVHWTDDGKIVVSDMDRGVIVLRFRG